MCLCAKGSVLRIDTHRAKRTKSCVNVQQSAASPLLSSPLQHSQTLNSLILSTTIGYTFWLLCKLRLWWDCEMSEGTNGRFLTHIQWQASNSWLSLEHSSWGRHGHWLQRTVDTDRNQSHRCEICQAAGTLCVVLIYSDLLSDTFYRPDILSHTLIRGFYCKGMHHNLCLMNLNDSFTPTMSVSRYLYYYYVV